MRARELEVSRVRGTCIEALMKLEAAERAVVLQYLRKMFRALPICDACGVRLDATLCATCAATPPSPPSAA